MPLMLYFATSGAFLFGYAKPVPVNFGQLRRPKRDMIWVALAGPASNFIQAILWAHRASWCWSGTDVDERFFLEMCKAGVLVNLVMWAFNLFPLPPLDGGRVLVGLLPRAPAYAVQPHRALGLLHRAGPGAGRHRRHLLAAPADGARLLSASTSCSRPLTALLLLTRP